MGEVKALKADGSNLLHQYGCGPVRSPAPAMRSTSGI